MRMNTMNARNVPSDKQRHQQEPLEAGVYPARLVQIISMGTQEQRPYQGQPKDPRLQFRVTYELLDEFCRNEEGEIEEDRPRWVSEDFPIYSLESERAKSTRRYYAIDKNEEHKGDWSELIGMPVMVTLTATPGKGKNEGRIFNNVEDISTMRGKDAENAPALVNDAVVFDYYSPDIEVFMSLPEWLQDSIKKSVDFEGSALETAISNYKKDEDKGEKPEAAPESDEPQEDDIEW